MTDIPRHESWPDDAADVEKVFEGLPVTLNLSDNKSVIGWSSAFRNKSTGETTIVLTLDAESSEKLGDLVEVFKLYAIGFAGIARRPQSDTPQRR
jgi:hypothetical protein